MRTYSHNNWVPQDEISTAISRLRTQTAWLEPFRARIVSTLRSSYAADPSTDQYTVDVFESLTEGELLNAYADKLRSKGQQPRLTDQAERARLLSAVKKDLGVRVAIELVDLFGAARVETLRKPGSRSADSQPTGRAWPKNATPHRIRA